MLIKTKLSGHFRLEVRNAYTHQLTKVREFDNLITNNGLDAYGLGYDYTLGRCWIGKSTKAPSVSDARLGAAIAYTDGASNINQCKMIAPTAPNWITSSKTNYRFAAGEATGDITEVGISTRNDPGNDKYALWSRALILDNRGYPTSLTVLEDEYLDVYYTLNLHPNLEDTAFSFNLGGETYNCVSRIANAQDARCRSASGNIFGQLNFGNGITIRNVYNSNVLGTINQTIQEATKFTATNGAHSISEYILGSHYRDCTVVFDVNTGNIEGGISGIEIGPKDSASTQLVLYNQISLDHPIPKDTTNAIKFVLRSSWSRYES